MSILHLKARTAVAGLSLVAVGLVGGATVAAVGTANAADPSPSVTASSPTSADTDRSGGTGETALTGDTLAKVKAAVSAKYPGATFERVETDDGGVYEAHITTAAGDEVTVAVDKAFAVTGTQSHDGRGGRHGGGPGGGAGETALTGDALAKVRAAVSAKYPGATFDRVETDSDGVYEAHITTSGGDRVTVELDKAPAITGTE